MEEEWKDIIGFEGKYQISNLGRVKSLERVTTYKNTNQTGLKFTGVKYCNERILKTYIYGRYEHVSLKKGCKYFNYTVHRLVAEYFIPNPNNYDIVNHKDENKMNNRADNLEWCTQKYNLNYGTRNERIAAKLKDHHMYYIPVLCYDLNNNFIKKYESAVAAGNELGISASGITACCRLYKGRASAAGFKWKYEKSDIDISTIEYQEQKKVIHQFDLDGNFIRSYESISEGARQLGKDVHNFKKAIKKCSAYNYLWLIDGNYADFNNGLEDIYNKKHYIWQIDLNGKIVNKFKSTLEVEEKLGFEHSNICKAMNSKTSDGKLFRKVEDYYWVNTKKDPDYEIDFDFKKGHGEKKVIQYDLDGNLLNEFYSIKDAQEFLGIDRDKTSAIYDCFKPNSKKETAYGFIWKLKEND